MVSEFRSRFCYTKLMIDVFYTYYKYGYSIPMSQGRPRTILLVLKDTIQVYTYYAKYNIWKNNNSTIFVFITRVLAKININGWNIWNIIKH